MGDGNSNKKSALFVCLGKICNLLLVYTKCKFQGVRACIDDKLQADKASIFVLVEWRTTYEIYMTSFSGNICRSPIAEAVFLHAIKERGIEDQWVVDSAALGNWHVGGNPEKRALNVLKSKGIDYKHTVRQVS